MTEVISWLALGVSVVAIGISAWATIYTKKQADAAVGDILPDVELNTKVRGEPGMGRPIDVVVQNHNRQVAHIVGFNFRAPDGVVIAHIPAPGKPASPPARTIDLPFPVEVKPLAGNVPTRFKFVFRVKPEVVVPSNFEISCDVRMRIGNGRRTIKRHCFKVVAK